jgi:hypothetical protein
MLHGQSGSVLWVKKNTKFGGDHNTWEKIERIQSWQQKWGSLW